MTTLTQRKWLLASASPRRRNILSGLGLRFEVDPSPSEPERADAEPPAHYAVRAAKSKARAVGGNHPGALVIAADTIVVTGEDILGKPADDRQAAAMLSRLSGRWHEVVTGLCLLDTRTGRMASTDECSRVRFRRLTRSEIRWYLQTGEHRDKAGAYAIQGCGALLVDRIEGCYFNVVGFPIVAFDRLCRRHGIRLGREICASNGRTK